VIIAGGRDFNDYRLLKSRCDNLLSFRIKEHNIIIISGTAEGADRLGERYAIERGYAIEKYPAEWKKHGLAAGPIRNEQMSNVADALIAFWDGESRGTKDMIKKARKKNLLVRVIYYNQ
jgi:hypothetical protein